MPFYVKPQQTFVWSDANADYWGQPICASEPYKADQDERNRRARALLDKLLAPSPGFTSLRDE